MVAERLPVRRVLRPVRAGLFVGVVLAAFTAIPFRVDYTVHQPSDVTGAAPMGLGFGAVSSPMARGMGYESAAPAGADPSSVQYLRHSCCHEILSPSQTVRPV